jgi:hypothetical protein
MVRGCWGLLSPPDMEGGWGGPVEVADGGAARHRQPGRGRPAVGPGSGGGRSNGGGGRRRGPGREAPRAPVQAG